MKLSTLSKKVLLELANSREILDHFAQKVNMAIYSSFELLIEKTKNSKKGEAWSNDDCRKALIAIYCIQKHKFLDFAAKIENLNAVKVLKDVRIKLYKMVKKAKQKYYQKVIDKLDHKNIF